MFTVKLALLAVLVFAASAVPTTLDQETLYSKMEQTLVQA
jgi:hypothetical protein